MIYADVPSAGRGLSRKLDVWLDVRPNSPRSKLAEESGDAHVVSAFN